MDRKNTCDYDLYGWSPIQQIEEDLRDLYTSKAFDLRIIKDNEKNYPNNIDLYAPSHNPSERQHLLWSKFLEIVFANIPHYNLANYRYITLKPTNTYNVFIQDTEYKKKYLRKLKLIDYTLIVNKTIPTDKLLIIPRFCSWSFYNQKVEMDNQTWHISGYLSITDNLINIYTL